MSLGTIAVSRIGFHAQLMLGSSILTATGIGMLSTLTPKSRFAAWVGYQAIAGIGIGLGISIPITATKLLSDIDLASTTVPVCLFMQAIGGTVFVSVGQSIFINKFVASLEVHSADLVAVLSSGLTDFGNATGNSDDVKLAYNSSLTCSFVAGAAVAAASVIGSLVFCWEIRLLRLARHQSDIDEYFENENRRHYG
jgi:hypothetical protein